MNDEVVFDFDGVICDSAFECFIVSYFINNNLNELNFSSNVTKKLESSSDWIKFKELRPVGNNGGDFVQILQLMETIDKKKLNKKYVRARMKLKINQDKLAENSKVFYELRNQLKSHNFNLWLSLHAIYNTSNNFLKELIADYKTPINIVTTKDSASVLDLLAFNGFASKYFIVWGREQLKSKRQQISEIKGQNKSNVLHFIEDNIQNLQSCRDSGVKLYLAMWGYVDAEISDTKEIKLINSLSDINLSNV